MKMIMKIYAQRSQRGSWAIEEKNKNYTENFIAIQQRIMG